MPETKPFLVSLRRRITSYLQTAFAFTGVLVIPFLLAALALLFAGLEEVALMLLIGRLPQTLAGVWSAISLGALATWMTTFQNAEAEKLEPSGYFTRSRSWPKESLFAAAIPATVALSAAFIRHDVSYVDILQNWLPAVFLAIATSFVLLAMPLAAKARYDDARICGVRQAFTRHRLEGQRGDGVWLEIAPMTEDVSEFRRLREAALESGEWTHTRLTTERGQREVAEATRANAWISEPCKRSSA